MRRINHFILLGVLLGGLAIPGYAASVTMDTTAVEAAVNTLTIANTAAVGADIGTGSSGDKIADITIGNNNPDGFNLIVEGTTGKLCLTDAVNCTDPGNTVPYSLQVVYASGTKGMTETQTAVMDMSGLVAARTTAFSTGITRATDTAVFNVNYHASADATALAGSFTDSVTIQVVDI
jgi:hypothetical protein